MKILVVGGGGREHALVWKLNQSSSAKKIYCAPGNPGTSEYAESIPINVNQVYELAEFAESKNIDLTVVGPEESLVLGITDKFKQRDLTIFGPDRKSALLEGSKAHAKKVMQRLGIPTAAYQEFSNFQDAWSHVQEKGAPIVIKVDGLAAGKGVTVAKTLEDAKIALDMALIQKIFGKAGNKVVVEEFLHGEEMTLLAFVDGTTVLPMIPSQDHKPLFDGDRGPNTGGMGAYSPVSHLEKWLPKIREQILDPLAVGLAAEGSPYRGILYVGLMLNESGPMVVEFNVRFGDPEAQVVLPMLENDLIEILIATKERNLDRVELKWKTGASVCVIATTKGYPWSTEKGFPIELPAELETGTQIFHSGTTIENETLVTAGGRVLGITAQESNIEKARERVYTLINQIQFHGKYFRKDIGAKAFSSIAS